MKDPTRQHPDLTRNRIEALWSEHIQRMPTKREIRTMQAVYADAPEKDYPSTNPSVIRMVAEIEGLRDQLHRVQRLLVPIDILMEDIQRGARGGQPLTEATRKELIARVARWLDAMSRIAHTESELAPPTSADSGTGAVDDAGASGDTHE